LEQTRNPDKVGAVTAQLQVVEEKIDVELLVAHGKPVLASHKSEPYAEFEKKLA
jgi:hypothetical protein